MGQYPSRRTSPGHILGNIALFDAHIDSDVQLRITKHTITTTKRLRQKVIHHLYRLFKLRVRHTKELKVFWRVAPELKILTGSDLSRNIVKMTDKVA